MLIGFEKRFIFVANSKTASTSIERVLQPHSNVRYGGTPARKHISIGEIEAAAPWIFRKAGTGVDGFFTFGVMREPIDWIFSWFRYRKQSEVQSPIDAELSFEAFWRRKDWNIQRLDGRKHLQAQVFSNADGRVMTDVILRHNDVSDGFARICAGLGIDAAPLPKANVSRTASKPEIPEELVEEMRAFYADDYALWNRLDAINEAGMRKLDRLNPN